ncbi:MULTISPECIES: glutathione S-transferase family protein [Cupriavidus]|uniref:glutathione S-transferase family protein n=1 Tax=Cupriavidus TaxID=106589 RepID=UPI0003A38D85|nr:MULTISPECIES: glutathione S-transferase [Cupriavidus]
MKVHDITGFPNPARIRIALAEKGMESQVEFVRVNLYGAEHQQGAFREKNPTSTVPVLELDDGTFISECIAITEYLDNLDGNPILTGRTAREKAVIHMMQKRADDQLINGIGVFFHHSTPGLGKANEAFKSADWAFRKQWGDKHGERAMAGMRYFDGVLRTQPYVAGEQFSVADITVWAALMHGDYAGLAVPADHTALLEWRARVGERPSVKNRSGQDLIAEDLPYLEPLIAYLNGKAEPAAAAG